MLRAWAATSRSALPESCTDRLPDVTPSLGLNAVLAGTMQIRDRSICSPSATICAKAVLMPWPKSTLPLRTKTVPSDWIDNQLASNGLAFRLVGSSPVIGTAWAPVFKLAPS